MDLTFGDNIPGQNYMCEIPFLLMHSLNVTQNHLQFKALALQIKVVLESLQYLSVQCCARVTC